MAISQAVRNEIYELRHVKKLPWAKIYVRFDGIPQSTLRWIAAEEYRTRVGDVREEASPTPPPPKAAPHKVEFAVNGREATAYSQGDRIKTLAQLLAAADVNLDEWQVAGWTANKWEMAANVDGEIVITPLFQVKARLVPNDTAQTVSLIEDMREDVRQYAPIYPQALSATAVNLPTGDHMLEISVFDLHVGKWAWQEETGEGYDMETAERLFHWAVDYLAEAGLRSGDIGKILLPLGNDLFNADNFDGMTTIGTPQDMHGTHREHFRRVRTMVKTAVDRLQAIAPVEIVIVPGNHDRQTMYYLGEALEDWYWNNERVTVDNSPLLRKYVRYGRNLIGLTHGSDEKANDLPMLMAQEAAGDWSLTENGWREFHVGHLHRKRETKYLPVTEVSGVRVRIIPSLTAADRWHYRKGYTNGVRAAEGYLWHKEHGLVGQFSTPATLFAEMAGNKLTAN